MSKLTFRPGDHEKIRILPGGEGKSVGLVKLDLKKPHQVYKLANGQKVPGTTTVLRVLAKDALLTWYGNMERSGIIEFMRDNRSPLSGDDGIAWTWADLQEALPVNDDGDPKLFATTKRDAAAATGSILHARVEAWLKGTDIDPEGLDPEQYKQSGPGLERFQNWFNEQGLEVTHTEHQMVSEKRKTGGTGDHFCLTSHPRADVRRVYLDLKSSNASRYWPYVDTIAQSSEYARLFEETTGEHVDDVWVVRVGKSATDRTQAYKLLDAERAWGERLFDAALMAYESKWQLDQMRQK